MRPSYKQSANLDMTSTNGEMKVTSNVEWNRSFAAAGSNLFSINYV